MTLRRNVLCRLPPRISEVAQAETGAAPLFVIRRHIRLRLPISVRYGQFFLGLTADPTRGMQKDSRPILIPC